MKNLLVSEMTPAQCEEKDALCLRTQTDPATVSFVLMDNGTIKLWSGPRASIRRPGEAACVELPAIGERVAYRDPVKTTTGKVTGHFSDGAWAGVEVDHFTKLFGVEIWQPAAPAVVRKTIKLTGEKKVIPIDPATGKCEVASDRDELIAMS